jgi:hypothetical protein
MRARSNRQSGYALISIMVIGLAAVLLMMALASMIMAVSRNEVVKKNQGDLINGAEIGVDYAINTFNAAAAAGNTASIDVGSSQTSQQTPVPSALLLGVPNMTVSVNVKKIPTPLDWQKIASWSSIYSPQTDSSQSVNSGYLSPPTTNIQLDSWRILEVTSSYPSGLSKTVRVVLQPRYDTPPNGASVPGASPGYFFNYGMFGNQGIAINPTGGLTVSGVNPNNPNANDIDWDKNPTHAANYELTLASNELFQLSGATTVLQGNVQVSSVLSGGNPVANYTPNGSSINGTVEINGQPQSTLSGTSGLQRNSGDNIFADADKVNSVNAALQNNPLRFGTNNTQPFGSQLTPAIAQNTMAPGINASSSTASLPDLTTLPKVSGLGILAPGDYQTATLDTSGVGGGVPPVSITGPTRVFVNGQALAANSNFAVNVDSKALQNTGDPQNLQIWYNGNLPVNINVSSGNSFKGLVYAPNAKVNLSGSGTFEGSVVGANVAVTMSGNLNLRTDLSPQSGTKPSGGNVPTYQFKPTTGSVVTGYRAVTWQEVR